VPLSSEFSVIPETCLEDDGVIDISLFTGSGDYTILWDDDPANTDLIREDLDAGTYSVTISDNVFNCSFSEDFTVENLIFPEVNALGTEVTILEVMPQLVPVEDEEIAKTLEREFKKQGIKSELGVEVKAAKLTASGVQVTYLKKGKEITLETEAVIQAVGVVALLEGTVDPALNLKTERGYLSVDDSYMTNVAGIFAAGDIIGPPWLAHVATFEAVQAVNGMFGVSKPRRVKNFPGATYCQPQIASTGVTEKKAKESGLDYKVGKFPFVASGKAVAGNHAEGFVKVISDAKTGEIFGAHIIGRDATELITEYCLAMEMEGTIEEIHGTIHAHPTLSEALAEAAAATHDEAIHI